MHTTLRSTRQFSNISIVSILKVSNLSTMSETFSWSLPGLNRRHFTAFANLLALRNGGQVEPASLRGELSDHENLEDASDASSIDKSRPQRISNSGYNGLKMKFLDCLAEFAANQKGGKSVACSAMREAEESVALWITRNEGFLSSEKPVFDEIGELLSNISCNEGICLLIHTISRTNLYRRNRNSAT